MIGFMDCWMNEKQVLMKTNLSHAKVPRVFYYSNFSLRLSVFARLFFTPVIFRECQSVNPRFSFVLFLKFENFAQSDSYVWQVGFDIILLPLSFRIAPTPTNEGFKADVRTPAIRA